MQKILSKIVPGKEERAQFDSVTASFLKQLNSKLKSAQAILGGSGAKDTWLSGSHDVDLFVQFDYGKYCSQNDKLPQFLQEALKKAFPKQKIERLHGSRDYFQLCYENIDFEIIPILKVSSPAKAMNITDLSPLHSIWVNKHTKKLKNDIRLAKQFCKANRLYGAESYIGGFSGYVLEILVAHYGSFEKLLKAATKWKPKDVIDPENYYPKKDALFNLNSSKQQSLIILIDPTDKNRNAAAALSLDVFERFKKAAGEYLKKPSEKFFEKEEINYTVLKAEAQKKKLHLVFFEVEPLEKKLDVAGAQMVKAFEYLRDKLNSFVIHKSGWEWDKFQKAQFYFLVEKDKLSEFVVRAGPPAHLGGFVADFRKKNKDVFEEDGRIYARIKVEHPLLADFVKNVIKEEYVRERVKNIHHLK